VRAQAAAINRFIETLLCMGWIRAHTLQNMDPDRIWVQYRGKGAE
jgi:hypothetical protein